jgi:hypothetical protein
MQHQKQQIFQILWLQISVHPSHLPQLYILFWKLQKPFTEKYNKLLKLKILVETIMKLWSSEEKPMQ